MGKFSRMIQDSILYEMSVTQTEIERLENKREAEGLSEFEEKTLNIKKQKLERLRRM